MAERDIIDEIQDAIQRTLKFRADLIDQVCAHALRDGRYGVLVHTNGVRIDKTVPPRTIHYENYAAALGVDPFKWTADFTIPED